MTTIQFLGQWAIRSSVLILSGALLLWALRVKDPAIRLAAWTALLFGSLAIPALTTALPKVPLVTIPAAAEAPVAIYTAPAEFRTNNGGAQPSRQFEWPVAALTIYLLVSLALLLRTGIGLAMSLRLLRASRTTDQKTEGIETRESDRVAAPVALGILRPSILLPVDWRNWDAAKLDAVLAHERSHIRRHDPAVQLLSAIHRALLWHSPLSWFLHLRIVRVAEEASDDAAVAVTGDRALYAEVLLAFIQRGVRTVDCGVPMARYGRADKRIDRILSGTKLSRGVTRWSVTAIVALGSPLAYVVAAAHPQSAPQVETRSVPAVLAQAAPIQEAPARARQIVAQAAAPARPQPAAASLEGLGTVVGYTVRIKSRVDGQLMSVNFNEGGLVRQGQLLASIDPRPFQIQVTQVEGQLAQDQAQLTDARQAESNNRYSQTARIAQLEAKIRTDQAVVDGARLQLNYTQIVSPIAGVAGLRLVEPGNIVHAEDATAIVIINQLQPISVQFNLAEDVLPQVRALLGEGASLPVEAWNRDVTVKLATGRLTAVDNQIDTATGTVKLKAEFENKDGALFPNQFVNVRLLLKAR